MAEEILPLAVYGTRAPQWDTTQKVRELFSVTASGNFPAVVAQKQIREAIDYIRNKTDNLKAIADERAKELLAEHNRVKEYTSEGAASEVTACLPIDVMGVFVLLPAEE